MKYSIEWSINEISSILVQSKKLIMNRVLVILFLLFSVAHISHAQSFDIDVVVEIDQNLQPNFKSDGRLLIFLNSNLNAEPRNLIWPSPGNHIIAKNINSWGKGDKQAIESTEDWIKTGSWGLDNVPGGEYVIQAVWDQDHEESRINAPVNLFSTKKIINVNKDQSINLSIDQKMPERKVVDHPLVKEVTMVSDTLSSWWNKEMILKATVLIPVGYQLNTDRTYPIRYNVAGYGGRYTRVNRLAQDTSFMNWWTSDTAPGIITVFLDGEGPFGDSYQLDSDNSGPFGYSLIHELIPHIEEKYRGTHIPQTRFVDGCSTGGWVSLGLQLYYPDHFNGVYSYSPDAIDFSNYQLINVYKDQNAYINEHGYERPVARNSDGEPWIRLRDFVQYENVLGASDTYLNSGGQFSAHTALYSPKGDHGLPKPLWDPITGDIDHTVAKYWEKYDLKKYAEKHWEELGPKLHDKIYVWMGDMDEFYLNIATRSFHDFLKAANNPKSNAEVVFTATQGHCRQYSHKRVLLQIEQRLKNLGY